MRLIQSYTVEADVAEPDRDENDPGLAFCTLMAVSVLTWSRFEKGERPAFLHNLVPVVHKALGDSVGFCKHFGISTRTVNSYFEKIMHNLDDTDETLESMENFMESIKNAMPSIRKNHEVDYEEIDLINTARLWHGNRAPAKIASIKKLINRLHLSSDIQRGFTEEIKSQGPFIEILKETVKKLTGKEGLVIPMEKIPEYREKDPELWKVYLEASRAVNGIYKSALHNYITQVGSPQPIQKVREHLESLGIVHRLPNKAFTGMIDNEGRLYTNDGKLIKGVPSPESKIVQNKDYEHDAEGKSSVFKTILPTKNAKGENNEAYYYTEEKLKENKQGKFDVIQRMLKVERKMVAAWRKDLVQNTDEDSKVLAAQCEITYLTAMRIGGAGNENKKGKTYGLTTLLVGNLKKRGTSIALDYIGKDAVHQTHVISPGDRYEKEVIRVLNILAEGKRRADLLFELDGVVFGASKLRTYFKKICPIAEATPHKIRHLRGTRLADEMLPPLQAKLLKKRNLSQAMVNEEFKNAVTKIGKILGHVRGVKTEAKATWSTAVNAYIDPSVVLDFYAGFADMGIRVPKFLLRAVN